VGKGGGREGCGCVGDCGCVLCLFFCLRLSKLAYMCVCLRVSACVCVFVSVCVFKCDNVCKRMSACVCVFLKCPGVSECVWLCLCAQERIEMLSV